MNEYKDRLLELLRAQNRAFISSQLAARTWDYKIVSAKAYKSKSSEESKEN